MSDPIETVVNGARVIGMAFVVMLCTYLWVRKDLSAFEAKAWCFALGVAGGVWGVSLIALWHLVSAAS
ncbi:hypothetical protein [Chitinasiproducens palmae]|uniref:DUF2788 domain-containing protein n=1 Tax=Chitinasiproducens palmae TaxID=1770053 RepID=A0A1H2PR09_9BURK|nr:hypothetical protein [Chitinasiproducens palmae]SDV49213.1 hypothetical protein SAMN05216551_107156 [Chitinasiproducens palmae]